MSAAPDPEQLDVDAARLADVALEIEAMGLHCVLGQVAPGDVALPRRDVDVVEEVLAHVAVVAVNAPGPHGEVLVKVEGRHVGEVEPLVAVKTNQLPVHADGC